MKKNIIISLTVLSLMLPLFVLAQAGGGGAVPPLNPGSSVANTLSSIAKAILAILAAAAVLMVVVAAFQFLTAGGDPEKVGGARDKVVYAIVAVLVGALAWAIITLIAGAIK